MLVLTRKVGDVIAIGDNIKIVVMAIKGKQVRLGIQADKNTIVHREEVYQKIQQANIEALNSHMDSASTAGGLIKSATPPESTDDGKAKKSHSTMKFVKSSKSSDSNQN
jgi:carbon storage regulator